MAYVNGMDAGLGGNIFSDIGKALGKVAKVAVSPITAVAAISAQAVGLKRLAAKINIGQTILSKDALKVAGLGVQAAGVAVAAVAAAPLVASAAGGLTSAAGAAAAAAKSLIPEGADKALDAAKKLLDKEAERALPGAPAAPVAPEAQAPAPGAPAGGPDYTAEYAGMSEEQLRAELARVESAIGWRQAQGLSLDAAYKDATLLDLARRRVALLAALAPYALKKYWMYGAGGAALLAVALLARKK